MVIVNFTLNTDGFVVEVETGNLRSLLGYSRVAVHFMVIVCREALIYGLHHVANHTAVTTVFSLGSVVGIDDYANVDVDVVVVLCH